MTLFLQQTKAAGQSGLVQYQNFANAANCHRLELGYGSEDGELGSPDTRGFEGQVVETGNGTSGAAEVKGGTGAGAVKVEGLGRSALDMHMQLKYIRAKVYVKRVLLSAGSLAVRLQNCNKVGGA